MPIQRRQLLRALGVGSAVGLAGCQTDFGSSSNRDGLEGVGFGDQLTLATTTSTYDSGLIDALVPAFEQAVGTRVKPVVKGTGAALRTAADGDADLVLVHARGAEDEFLRTGYGTNRRDVMYNDFVVVGPESDSAGIHGMDSVTSAFAAIANGASLFVSRGDDSGTHRKEQAVWESTDVDPGGSWYQETGQGQGDTLLQADIRGAYALTDRGTYLAMLDELDLVVHVQGPLEGGPAILKNPYGTMPVNPAVHEDVNYALAMAFVGFVTGPRGQSVIAGHTASARQLFVPNALAPEPDFQQYVPEGWATEAENV